MNKIIIAITIMTIISSSSFAAQSKGAVVLSSKSWITSGNDPTIHVVEGHLTNNSTHNLDHPKRKILR
jgi:hypothetical protein